ncbi:3'-5' exoribonuclease YhaM [Shouchella sp. JSM 1781072]|uniref:3'-5' exoribonuclease YhaM n=1 Tax=Bacillaceae TaxID=186817 RepID=UPI000C076148|nr:MULTISPECIES: 3'-5' exoribonuclease YhaM [Bacillaceae]UTR07810.1 3'-5' exoribonuclease YhaM [Alkalihalobacillus sp. LMS6]
MEKGIKYHQVGEAVNRYLLIKTATKQIASNSKPFLTLILGDHTGEIEAKLWGVSPEDEGTFVNKTIVHIQGDVIDYRGRTQLKIASIRPTSPMDGVEINDFVRSAPLSAEDMLDEVNQFIFDIQNPNIQRITRFIVKKHQAAFVESPAATKNHHEFMGGLAFHVVSMLRLAKNIAAQYTNLDTDLLYAGVILHDIGKVKELSGAIDTTYTLEGKLLGHISIGAMEIHEAAHELNIEGEELIILQHLMLSHHGKGEWGSPKPPYIREAEVLHMIDNVDAKINMMDRALERVEPGEFSERVMPLENRSFYKPSFHKKPLDL